ncbi:MAG: magnesium transporter CorA family protein [Bacillota bacterium]|nr:magnesium transporter CorA family protein [Bacillota bacterium]
MIKFYKTIDGKITQLDSFEQGCWVNAVCPNEDEVNYLINELGLVSEFVRSSLDEEETSRIDTEEEQNLIMIDVPVYQSTDNVVSYFTIPIGIIFAEKNLITICLKENTVLKDFAEGLVKNVDTAFRTQFVLYIMLRSAMRFHQYLKQIEKVSSFIERQLHLSTKNKELIQLLDLQKSLVYFSTSLKADEITMQKIFRGRVIKLYEEDQDLLDDVLIETKQAIEMTEIYQSILTGTSDAFASIISNNLNIVMKVLTSITIIMAIPTMISSFYGMNVNGIPFSSFYFPLSLSLVFSFVAFIILKRKKLL